MYLILVRHAEPTIDREAPARTWTLSAHGRDRARRLAAKLERFAPDVVVSSREPKARETAEILAGSLGVDALDWPGLEENDRTSLGFLSQREYDDLMERFFTRPAELILGRETAHMARARFGAAVLDLLRQCPQQTVVVVAHGAVMTLFVSEYHDVEPARFWKTLEMPSYVALARPSFDLLEVGTPG